MQEQHAALCNIINQIHGLEAKLIKSEEHQALHRRFQRIRKAFEAMNLYVHNPIGEDYSETRLDCEASISGEASENLKIIEVIKPLVYCRNEDDNELIQRAVVIVEGVAAER